MDTDARRAELWGLLGDLPPRDPLRGGPVGATLLAQEERDGYTLETLLLDLNGEEPVPAYFTRPPGGGPFPCILYSHAHGGDYALGKDELLRGRDALQSPPYAVALARLGMAALCFDHWCFGGREYGGARSEGDIFKLMLWEGRVLWGMMLFDSLRALDYLGTRPDVDARRIGALGLSMGSTMSWWLGALDARVRACVDICCLTDFHALIETGGLDGHGLYYYVPGLLKRFTTAQINALIAPRAHLSLAGLLDPLTPPAGLDRIDAALREAYAAAGAPAAWRLVRSPTGHFETAVMRAEIVAWLRRWL
jgi:hypothetical protein